MKNTNDFSKCKVGQKLWSIQLGECEVISPMNQTIECINNEGEKRVYWHSGSFHRKDYHTSLFWSKPEIITPEKPKEKIPFDLEKALSGDYDLVTRDGREVQEWKWFEKANKDDCPIVCVSNNRVSLHCIDGKIMYITEPSDIDLFLIEK